MFEPLIQSNLQYITSEEDVRRFIYSAQTPTKVSLNPIFRSILIGFIILGVAFIGINAPAFLTKSKFIVINDILSSQSKPISTPQIPLPGQNFANSAAISQPKLNIANNHIVIERIGLNAPINWGIEDNNDVIMKSLESGVSQLNNSVKPGEKGNIFIVGHSSNYVFAKGSYKAVFSLLPELVIGDKIAINYNNTIFNYTVTDKMTVSPNNISVKEKGDTAKLSLMTCVPLGTSLKRLVIIATPTDSNGTLSPQLPLVR
jgi:LPXTG-site transpeptidase (sortase) family protein